MENLRELKDRERKILTFMKKYIKENQYPPTVREVCSALNIKSTSTVHKDISNLEKAGYIIKDRTKSRALIISNFDDASENTEFNSSDNISVEASSLHAFAKDTNIPNNNISSLEGHSASNSTDSIQRDRGDIIDIPVVGQVAAGIPILANENIEDSFPVPSRFVKGGNNFMLVVKGESMIEAGIMDGDYILAQQANTANNGDIVIAMIEGDFEAEATVKTFYKENGHIRLQPENSSMSPIIVPECQILGKVKGVFRYF